MALNLTEISQQEERLAPGHRACLGCAEPIIMRLVLHAIDSPVVLGNSTGCSEIITSPYPQTAWRVPWIHVAFENVASVLSGAEAAYHALVKRGKIEKQNVKFVAFAGDGATYDIGLQFLSGAIERGHRFIYICFNNEAYMNTGIQRSSATPIGAWTTTSPVGDVVPGKIQHRKDLTAIIAAHDAPYVAQAAPHAWRDLITKVKKAAAADGPSFINVLSPCPRGWRHAPSDSVALSRMATETCMWPLYEVEQGQWRLTVMPEVKRPVVDWLKSQGRFAHLLRPENSEIVAKLQQKVDQDWERLLQRCGVTAAEAVA